MLDLEQVLNNEKKRIESNASRDRKATEYVINLIQSDPASYQDIFYDSEIPQDRIPQHLYDSVTRLIREVTHEYASPFLVGVRHFKRGHKPQTPQTRLGWVNYTITGENDNNEKRTEDCYTHSMTEKGLAIVDGYREIKGLKPFQETQEESIESFKRAIAS